MRPLRGSSGRHRGARRHRGRRGRRRRGPRRLHRRARVGKKWVDVSGLVGRGWGASFTVNPSDARATWDEDATANTVADTAACGLVERDSAEDDASARRNNAALVDAKVQESDNHAQRASHEEIEVWKAQVTAGTMTPAELVRRIAGSSSTFGTKTEFSQEKWIRKKAMKHAPRTVAMRPTARTVCEALYEEAPWRVGHVRPDSLGMALSAASVGGVGCRCLVVDGTGGLVAGAVAERVGGGGETTVAVPFTPGVDGGGRGSAASHGPGGVARDPEAALGSIAAFNLSAAARESTRCCALGDLLALWDNGGDGREAKKSEAAPLPKSADGKERACEPLSLQQASARLRRGFTAVIVAAPQLPPAPLLDRVLAMAAPGTSFVCLHPESAGLAVALRALATAKRAAALELYEPWFREHQILDQRTHPFMSHSGTGGFLLSGQRLAGWGARPTRPTASRGAAEPGEDAAAHYDAAASAEAGANDGSAAKRAKTIDEADA